MTTREVNPHCRILALEVRPRRMAYALFETPSKLVDFGVTRFYSFPEGIRRAASWLDRLRPTVLVLRKIERRSSRDRRRTRATMSEIRESVRHASIRISLITERQLQTCLRAHGVRTKHEIASFLAQLYPELAARLPAPRKAWQRENWHMPIFDAVALAITHLESRSKPTLVN